METVTYFPAEEELQFWQIENISPRLLGTPNSFDIWNPKIKTLHIVLDDSNEQDGNSNCQSFDLNTIEECTSVLSLPQNKYLNKKLPSFQASVTCLKLRTPLRDITNIEVKHDINQRIYEKCFNYKENCVVYSRKELIHKSRKKRSKKVTAEFSSFLSLKEYIEELCYSSRRHCCRAKVKLTESSSNNSILQQMWRMEARIDNLKSEAKSMRLEASSLSKIYRQVDDRACKLLTAARQLHEDIKDVCYLEELINLLDGRLEKINMHNWPFAIALNSLNTEVNLVI